MKCSSGDSEILHEIVHDTIWISSGFSTTVFCVVSRNYISFLTLYRQDGTAEQEYDDQGQPDAQEERDREAQGGGGHQVQDVPYHYLLLSKTGKIIPIFVKNWSCYHIQINIS